MFFHPIPQLIGLSFLFIEMKELCEARENLKQAQIFRFTQVKLMMDPPFKTARAQSELFTVQCDQ